MDSKYRTQFAANTEKVQKEVQKKVNIVQILKQM